MALVSTDDWLSTVGLVIDFAGAFVMIRAMFKSPDVIRSIATQAAVLGGRTDEKAVREFERDRWYGLLGGILLSIGFLLQLAGRFL